MIRPSAQVRAVLPLAIRSLRRQRLRYALMACLLGLAIATYLLYATFLASAGAQAALALAPYELPADVVYLGRNALTPAQLADWARFGSVERMAVGRVTTYRSNLGTIRVLALPADSPLWQTATSRGAPPQPGELLLPAAWLAGGQAMPPETVTLIPPLAPAGRTTLPVAGAHHATDRVLGSMVLALLMSPGPQPNSMFLWTRTASGAGSAANAIAFEYLEPQRPLLRRADDPTVVWTGTAEATARGVLSQTYLPGAGALTMIFIFCGIGLFTVSSLSFLDRKRDLAILKTIGLESSGVTAMFLFEQGVVALVGTALALVIAVLAVPRLGAFMPVAAKLSPASVFWGAFVGLLIQALGVALPTLTARVATVNQLLFNQPIPLERRRVYAGKE